MNNNRISEILIDHQNQIDSLVDPITKNTFNVLYNVIEVLSSELAASKEKIQNLENENSKLKGEQGKPKIKPNKKKDGDISSDEERKKAEVIDDKDEQKVGFRLNKKTIERLKEQRLPYEILDKLEKLCKLSYSSEKDFIKAVEAEIGDELVQQYSPILVKYARYKKRNRNSKLPKIHVDRDVNCPVDTSQLPKDAKPNGYEYNIVQDVIIKTDNVRFIREVYYSPSQNKTYFGEIPEGYEGEFGPNLKAHLVTFKYVNNMSIPKIGDFFRTIGTFISNSYISNLLTNRLDTFHPEKKDIYLASLEYNQYQQIDDTSSRVNGQNYHTHIVCNPHATVFFTTQRKDRLTILDVLRNFECRQFIFNDEAFELLEKLNVSKKLIDTLQEIVCEKVLNEKEIQDILNKIFPDPKKGKQLRVRIMEAAAIAYYHQQTGFPIVKVLICDDAPQFKLLTEELSLCWVHEGRHYKRLSPVVPKHQECLDEFIKNFWEYYHKLYKYKHNPSPEFGKLLSEEFDTLFSTKTGYIALDERIVKSKAKKKELLNVLDYPENPLHNNMSEIGARAEKRRQDVSLHIKSDKGAKAKDTMMTIVESCKKLGVNSYNYIYDRISGNFKMPSLASLIRTKKTIFKPVIGDSS